MINLSASGGSVVFTFANSTYYLYGDGTITVPVNSLSLVIDNSNIATFKKAATNDIFVAAPVAEFGMSKAEIEAFYKENMVGSTGGGGGGIDSGTVQSMIDASISGKADTDDLTAYTLTSVTEALDGIVTGHTADTTIHVTSSEKSAWNAKQNELTAGTGIDITNDVISCTVTGGGNNVVELTQAQYETLVDKDPDAFYIITDAPAIDLSGYAQTSAVTAEINAAVSGKQDTLVSGTNIKTINNQSLLGSGNIDIQGGGGSYTAGDGIDITNDVISTSYTGYTVFDSGTTTPESNLSNFEGQFLILCPIDCEGSTQGDAHFDVDGHSYPFTFYPETQTFNDNGDSSWQDYFALEWNNTYGAFMLTTNENQPIDAHDEACVRFLTEEIRYSGTTTDGINGALEVATKVDKQLGGLKFVRLTKEEYDALTTKNSDTLYIIVPAFGGLTVYYGIDGQAAQNEITLFNGGGESSGESSGGGGALPTTMIVDGVEETPVNTWRFEEGNHIVQYTFEDNTVPQMFLNRIDYVYEIKIGDDITTIAEDYAGDGVFAGMPALQKATIGQNVTTIGAYAFNTSSNLSTHGIYVKATTPPTLGSGAFDNTGDCQILVPNGTYGDYTSDISWSVYGQRIAELS